MNNVIVFMMLIYEAYQDLKRRSISLRSLLLFGIVGIAANIVCKTGYEEMLLGVFTGVAVIFVSLLSKGALGIGDGGLFLVIGLYLGGWKNLEVLLVSMVFAAMASLVLLLFFREKGWKQLPFVPFVLAAYVEVMLFAA